MGHLHPSSNVVQGSDAAWFRQRPVNLVGVHHDLGRCKRDCFMVLHAGGEGAWVDLDTVAGPSTSKVCAFLWPGQCHSSIESMDSQDAAWCTLSSSQVCAPWQHSDTQTPETLVFLRQNSALDAQMLQAVLPRGMVYLFDGLAADDTTVQVFWSLYSHRERAGWVNAPCCSKTQKFEAQHRCTCPQD